MNASTSAGSIRIALEIRTWRSSPRAQSPCTVAVETPKQLRPLDEAAVAQEDLPSELVEQARCYCQWCRNVHE